MLKDNETIPFNKSHHILGVSVLSRATETSSDHW